MIRSVLHTDPDSLGDPEWITQIMLAERLQNIFLWNLRNALGMNTQPR